MIRAEAVQVGAVFDTLPSYLARSRTARVQLLVTGVALDAHVYGDVQERGKTVCAFRMPLVDFLFLCSLPETGAVDRDRVFTDMGREMAVRARCGCVGVECRIHGTAAREKTAWWQGGTRDFARTSEWDEFEAIKAWAAARPQGPASGAAGAVA